ncbi:AI-2E family transporter [Chitinophaga caeni]|uniref:AI-2E family transporter n=1 Tax=Chitinophaga caeni TaxID=2029983 RepID=A0A291QWT1_9BACT|nr:AI-2E family transporter [Chitinophaga caeni]ATL48342.1 AI-2E family transporter [Chitinophaga caeni]
MNNLPITVRRSIELMGLALLCYILIVGNGIITPILLSFFLCLVILPIFRKLRSWKVPEVLSILICIIFLLMLLALLIWFFTSQIAALARDFPKLQSNITGYINSISAWINEKTDFTTEKQLEMINNESRNLVGYAGNILGTAASSISGLVVLLGLVPLYVFLMMYYRILILKFLYMWFPLERHGTLTKTIKETENVMKSYLVGLSIEIIYMTVLIGALLYFFGFKHALLIGVIVAILNLIPYIGPFIGNVLAILLTLTTTDDLWAILKVIAIIYVVQLIDNNILMPKIVGGQIKINALATILGVIIGGAIAGVPGMFMSLPVLAILKIIFSNSEKFKHWGLLLGDDRPERNPMKT